MPRIPHALSSYERLEGDLPGLPVVNMYAEEAPSEDEGVVLQSRRGLVNSGVTLGDGPVKALFRRDLVLNSALLGVSGGFLYDSALQVGNINGPGHVSMAGNEVGVMIAAGAEMYHYNGSTLSTVAFPDAANVVHVFTGGSRFWSIRKGTGKLYWTDVLGSEVDALAFATAESFPDRLLQGLWIDSMAILFGKESIEFWQQTGSATLPLTPLQNMVIEQGIKATGCAVQIGETFAAVSSRNTVIYGPQAQIISNAGIQERIEASTDVSLFTFLLDGVEFLALRLDSETQVWNISTGMWSKFKTLGLTNWAACCYADGVFGSAEDGQVFEWNWTYTDALATGSVLERRFRAGYVINSGGFVVDSLMARVNVGQTPYLSGDYVEPSIERRLSRDAGQTWGNYRSASLGRQGEYRTKVEWRANGQASQPGFLAEFRCTAPVPFRVSGVFINEPKGGR